MRLYVVRHGIAEETTPTGDDRGRRLTPRGQMKMRAGALGLKRFGVELDVLLTSPFVRAAETATIIAEVYDGRPQPSEVPALAQGLPPAETVKALRAYARHEHVAIVGHEPGLSGLVALLTTGAADGLAVDLKKGGVAAIDVDGVPGPRRGTLRWLVTPRQLRRLGR